MADNAEGRQGRAEGHALKVHHLRPAPGAKTAKTRVGRGEGSKGKTAGRGTKGTKARYQVPERFEGGPMPLHMRLPKLRGFKNPFRTEYQVVNLDRLAAALPGGRRRDRRRPRRQGRGPRRPPGQGARHRRDRRQGRRDGATSSPAPPRRRSRPPAARSRPSPADAITARCDHQHTSCEQRPGRPTRGPT